MAEKIYDVIVIGGGVAGLAAAMYSGRFGMKSLVLEGKALGGTIILTDEVSNYPGFVKLTGLELGQKMEEHARDYPSVEVKEEKAIDIRKEKKLFVVKTDEGSYSTKTIIYATGTKWRKMNVPGEKEYSNKGVHYCALCDGPLYKGKVLGVVGGADSAVKEANLLAEFGSKIMVFARGEKLRAEPVNMKKLLANKKIEAFTKTKILEVKGDKFVTHVITDKPINGSTTVKLDGLFVEIGHLPLSDLAKKIGVKTDSKGEIIINRDSETNVPGFFAAGDVVDTKFKQAITGVAEGVVASYNAYQYVSNEGL